MKVLPFLYYDGIPTVRDSGLADLYNLMVRDDTRDIVFHDGSIKTVDEFIHRMKLPTILLFVAYEDKKPLAFGWLTHIEHRTARAHFCFFKEVWGKRSVEIGKMIIEKAMFGTNVDMLIGMVPIFNKSAVKFAQKCGATLLGELPHGSLKDGISYPTVIVYYTR